MSITMNEIINRFKHCQGMWKDVLCPKCGSQSGQKCVENGCKLPWYECHKERDEELQRSGKLKGSTP